MNTASELIEELIEAKKSKKRYAELKKDWKEYKKSDKFEIVRETGFKVWAKDPKGEQVVMDENDFYGKFKAL